MMPQSLHRTSIALALVWLAAIFSASAQPAANSGKTPFSASLEKKSVSFFWPESRMDWVIMQQQPANTGEWKAIESARYQTNSGMITVTLPLPKHATLYRIKPWFMARPPALPPMPPHPSAPPAPTARSRGF